MRLFLAFELPEEIREHVRQLQRFLQENGVGGKYPAPEHCHVTTVFLGDCSEENATRLSEGVRRLCAETPPFSLQIQGLGSFKLPPRLMFLDASEIPEGSFTNFVYALRQKVQDEGVELKKNVLDKPPKAHVTLVRFKKGKDSKPLKDFANLSNGRWEWYSVSPPQPGSDRIPCEEMTLYESILHSDGPEYREVEKFPLG